MFPLPGYRSAAFASVIAAATAIPMACDSPVAVIPRPDGGDAGGDGESAGVPPPPQQPTGWDEGIRVPDVVDTNPDPSIVEVNLEARLATYTFVPGGPTAAWTYNGLVPGPILRANVGDRVIVHFTNQLPEATSIHWHGLRIPNAMDGMPGVSQPPVDHAEAGMMGTLMLTEPVKN